MSLPTLPPASRFGVSNCLLPNAASFAQTVLRLQSSMPVYQQQIVHSTAWAHGPARASAEWCLAGDNEWWYGNIVRSISAHDTQFARRNLTNAVQFAWIWHAQNTNNQLYYVVNEPEAGSVLAVYPPPTTGCPPTSGTCGNCWDPRDRNLDPYDQISACFPNPGTQFWEDLSDGFLHSCGTLTGWKRIQAKALAFVFLRMKRLTEGLGRGHIVLPPSSITPLLGAGDAFWQSFYDRIHGLLPLETPCSEAAIAPVNLKALHLHHYAAVPQDYPCPPSVCQPQDFRPPTPLDSVAFSATIIRKGVDWYRNRYVGAGVPLPLDVLLSEMGLDWRIGIPYRWAGGWSNIRRGLSWWNSWLYWSCYRAPISDGGCNLQSGFTFYPCIHEATVPPYATYDVTSGSGRNQWYVDTDAWDTYVHYNVPYINMGLAGDGGYQGTVSAWDSTPWGTLECPAPPPPVTAYWRRTPFGACYGVWSQVGSDTITGNLNTGWVMNTQAGLIGHATVSLQAGYNTIYFPVIKDMGAFPTYEGITIRWERPDGSLVPYTVTSMNLSQIQDSGDYNYNGYTQRTLSAMVWPAVCKASSPRTVTIQLWRSYSGSLIYVGRPIAMPGMCSWFATQ